MRQLVVVLFSSLLMVLQGLTAAKADNAAKDKGITPVEMAATASYDGPGKPESPEMQSFIAKQTKDSPWIAEILKTKKGVVLKITAAILFDKSDTVLTAAASDQIKKFEEILAKYPKDTITIVGHADNTGLADQNLTLSKQRAQAVKDELVKQGIANSHITVEGKGDADPIVANDTPENRAKNRRIEIYDIPIN